MVLITARRGTCADNLMIIKDAVTFNSGGEVRDSAKKTSFSFLVTLCEYELAHALALESNHFMTLFRRFEFFPGHVLASLHWSVSPSICLSSFREYQFQSVEARVRQSFHHHEDASLALWALFILFSKIVKQSYKGE